jgi:uncharacterized protein (TIGR02217 family)
MSIYAVQFPLTVSGWGATVRYKTDVIVGANGQEVRNALWQDPLLKFNAAFAVRTYEDIATLQTFFHAVKGREQAFLVKDYADFTISRNTIGTGDGADATWQLLKLYTQSGIGTYSRTITRPAAGSLSVWVNNTLKTVTTHYTFSTTTGVITFTGGNTPANGHLIEAACTEFYVPCRFDTDELDIELLSYWVESGANTGRIQIPEIPIVEVRE